MNQTALIDKTGKVRSALETAGDKLITHNRNVPVNFKDEYDELSNQINAIECLIYRALSEDAIDWCDQLLNKAISNINEFNFVVALYNNKNIL